MHHERVNPIFSSVLSQNSKLLVIAQLHPRSTEHLMSNIHLHNTIQHAFAAPMQIQTSHLCIAILSRTSCTHQQQQRRRQWIIPHWGSEVMRKRKVYASAFTRIQVELAVRPGHNWPAALLSRASNRRVDPPDLR